MPLLTPSNSLIYKVYSPEPADRRRFPSVRTVVFVLLYALVGAGCGTLSAPPVTGAEDIALPAGAFVSQGKMSLRPIGESTIKGFSANYRWAQTPEGYDIELWGALGQGRTRITGSADRIKIVDGSGRVVKSRQPEKLLRRHLGWSLPLAVLPYWLQGKAAPAPPAKLMRFQANADLESMEQLDWQLDFARYKTITGTERQERLPGRVKATNNELKLTIAARQWSLEGSDE